jgi:hypothetical protein
MKNSRLIKGVGVIGVCLGLCSCAGQKKAMYGYYKNHPEMRDRLIAVRTIYIAQSPDRGETADEIVGAVVDELRRKGKGRFLVVDSRKSADAVLEISMDKELGPVAPETPLPFTLEPEFTIEGNQFVRIRLVHPSSGQLIYKTTTDEFSEFEIDSPRAAAHAVIKNLMDEIER